MFHVRPTRANGTGLLVLGLTFTLAALARAVQPQPDLSPQERQKLEAQANECNQRVEKFYGERKLTAALKDGLQSLTINQRLYPPARYPNGHPQLANSLNNLAVVAWELGRTESALDYFQQALEVNRRLYPESKYPDGHPQLARNLNIIGFVLQKTGRPEPAAGYYEQALAMERRLHPQSKYPDGHSHLADNLDGLGAVFWELGRTESALDYFQQALEVNRRLYPREKYPGGHRDLANSLNNVGDILMSLSRSAEVFSRSVGCVCLRQEARHGPSQIEHLAATSTVAPVEGRP